MGLGVNSLARRGAVVGAAIVLAVTIVGCSSGGTTAGGDKSPTKSEPVYERVNPADLHMVVKGGPASIEFDAQGNVAPGTYTVDSITVGKTPIEVTSKDVSYTSMDSTVTVQTKDYGPIRIFLKTDGNDEIWLTSDQKTEFLKLSTQ